MFIDPPSVIVFSGGLLLAMVLSNKLAVRGVLSAQQIVREGQPAEGRVVRVWQPPIAGSFPRIYFEFQPTGTERLIRACHTDRRSFAGIMTSLPAVGSQVSIRYLPQAPSRAVIARLVTRFTH
jgi:hypothetical protein